MTEKLSITEILTAKTLKRSLAKCTPGRCRLYRLQTSSCTLPDEPKKVTYSDNCQYGLSTKHATDIFIIQNKNNPDKVNKTEETFQTPEMQSSKVGFKLPDKKGLH